MTVTVRRTKAADRPDWERLYRGYADFYGVAQTDEMRERVFGWLMEPGEPILGFVAVDGDGRLVGLAHIRAFHRPLSATVGGFLDDLFVDPAARGTGAVDALFAALKAEGTRRGWSVIRWITAEDNYRARAVYDRVGEKTRWLTYDIRL